MNFSYFIKTLRKELNLSQLQMVNKLASGHYQFSNLTVVNYSRWERGSSVPTLQKMYYVAKIFNMDIFKFLTTIKFKISSSQVNSFESFSKHITRVSDHFRLQKPQLHNETFHYYGIDGELIQKWFLMLAVKYWNVMLKQKNITDITMSKNKLDHLLNRGLLYASSCQDSENNEVLALGIYILQDISREKHLLDAFQSNTLNISDMKNETSDSDKFIFIPFLTFHSETWLNFNLYNFAKTFTKIKGLKKIYVIASQSNMVSKLKYLGFNVDRTKKTIIKNKVDDFYTESEISLYLMSCDFDDFICNHGLVNLIKNKITTPSS